MTENYLSEYARKFEYWFANRTLISISFVKPKQGPKRLWGRIIAYEVLPNGDVNFSLYNDDSKQVESLNMFSIDDFQPEKDPVFIDDAAAGTGDAVRSESESESKAGAESELEPERREMLDRILAMPAADVQLLLQFARRISGSGDVAG